MLGTIQSINHLRILIQAAGDKPMTIWLVDEKYSLLPYAKRILPNSIIKSRHNIRWTIDPIVHLDSARHQDEVSLLHLMKDASPLQAEMGAYIFHNYWHAVAACCKWRIARERNHTPVHP